MEPEIIIHKNAQKCIQIWVKLKVKFPATKHGYSMAKIAHLDDALSQFFELEASPVEGQSLLQEQKKET